MGLHFPPGDQERFSRIFANMRSGRREDALQEAWLAHLEGRDPYVAAERANKRLRDCDKRNEPLPENEDGEDLLSPQDGQRRTDLAASRQSKSLAPKSGHNSLAKAV
jgi:hypothetical protein